MNTLWKKEPDKYVYLKTNLKEFNNNKIKTEKITTDYFLLATKNGCVTFKLNFRFLKHPLSFPALGSLQRRPQHVRNATKTYLGESIAGVSAFESTLADPSRVKQTSCLHLANGYFYPLLHKFMVNNSNNY